jgi:uncharacterized Zn-finger protein
VHKGGLRHYAFHFLQISTPRIILFCFHILFALIYMFDNFYLQMRDEFKKLPRHDNFYICPYCGKKFSATSHLQGHLSIHTGVKEFSCTLCEKEYAYKYQLKKHLSVAHSINLPPTRIRRFPVCP